MLSQFLTVIYSLMIIMMTLAHMSFKLFLEKVKYNNLNPDQDAILKMIARRGGGLYNFPII
jgi:hypothetical protein